MTEELTRIVVIDLRAAVAGLEMEISDSVMEDLLAALAERLQADSNDGAAVILLMAMESVAKHVDTLRVRSDLKAFGLIEELWTTYDEILPREEGEQERQAIALAEMEKVLDWQRQCYLDLVMNPPVSKVKDKGMSPVVRELLQQQIAETGSLVEQEMAALKQMIADVSPESSHREEVGRQVSSAIAEQVADLQEFLSQEIGKLRQELQHDSGRV